MKKRYFPSEICSKKVNIKKMTFSPETCGKKISEKRKKDDFQKLQQLKKNTTSPVLREWSNAKLQLSCNFAFDHPRSTGDVVFFLPLFGFENQLF